VSEIRRQRRKTEDGRQRIEKIFTMEKHGISLKIIRVTP
jgi:hypothetical protein